MMAAMLIVAPAMYLRHKSGRKSLHSDGVRRSCGGNLLRKNACNIRAEESGERGRAGERTGLGCHHPWASERCSKQKAAAA